MMSDGSGGVPELFFSKLFQHFSDISVNADGLPLDFFRGEGFAEVDAGVAGIGPAAGHVPEGIFDDAGGVVAGAKFQKEDFGGLVAAERNSKACRKLLSAFAEIHNSLRSDNGFLLITQLSANQEFLLCLHMKPG